MTRKEAKEFIAQSVKSDIDMALVADAINTLEQEPCDDEYIKVPKKALKYRTAGMVAYNAEWLKNHFDIERAVICGAQEPCEDAVSREAVLDAMYALCDTGETLKENPWRDNPHIDAVVETIEHLSPVNPQPKTEKIIKMREATPEERESIDRYIKSISKSTGVDFWDLEQESCEDVISRILKRMWNCRGRHTTSIDKVKMEQIIRDELSSVNPQSKTGHWIRMKAYEKWGCSECNTVFRFTFKEHDYCPNCGAKMFESQERSE